MLVRDLGLLVEYVRAHASSRRCVHSRTNRTARPKRTHSLAHWPECKWQSVYHWLVFFERLAKAGAQSTIACALEQQLLHLKRFAYRLDGDNIRFGLNKDLGFSEADRNENIRRIGEARISTLCSVRPEPEAEVSNHSRYPSCSQMPVPSQLLPSSLPIGKIVNSQENYT
jgi:hypothetical protein